MLARSAYSRAPSPYPSLLFHAIRLAQFVCSTIVLSSLSYFVHYLIQDRYYIPWTFLVLLSVASFTDLSVIVTAYFYHYRQLKPRLSAVINIGLTALWMLGFALLTWNLSGTLSHECSVANWDHDTGVMVCRIYKAIETFTICGMLCTAGSLLLDLQLLRRLRSRGTYNAMNDPKRPIGGFEHKRDLAMDDFTTHDRAGEDGGFGGYREPSLEFPENSHGGKQPYKAQRAMEAERFGYRQPDEQTTYEGASARMLDRQFGEHES